MNGAVATTNESEASWAAPSSVAPTPTGSKWGTEIGTDEKYPAEHGYNLHLSNHKREIGAEERRGFRRAHEMQNHGSRHT